MFHLWFNHASVFPIAFRKCPDLLCHNWHCLPPLSPDLLCGLAHTILCKVQKNLPPHSDPKAQHHTPNISSQWFVSWTCADTTLRHTPENPQSPCILAFSRVCKRWWERRKCQVTMQMSSQTWGENVCNPQCEHRWAAKGAVRSPGHKGGQKSLHRRGNV